MLLKKTVMSKHVYEQEYVDLKRKMQIKRKIKDILLRLLPFYQWCYVKRLRFKKKINVVFFASSLSMWRYQHLYEAMSKHPRFNVWIVIAPAAAFSDSQKKKDIEILKEFFNSKNIPFLIGWDGSDTFLDIKNGLKPDILFYPQPYEGFYQHQIDYSNFYYKLLCYYPYAFWRSKGWWSYDNSYQRVAWKLFYSTELHRKDAESYCLFNKGRNVEIVGYPTADEFLSGKYVDVWKKQSGNKKRIIWAPHYTIFSGGVLEQSNFLWMADFMIEIAKRYSKELQLVFKPHPRLFSELCKHPEWGEEKAKEYYVAWETMENTQIQTGEFVNLFMTSDAMIHDSGSFGVEYHYTGNPVMYIAGNFEEQVAEMAEFGQLSMRMHYVGSSKEDIINFIEDTVIAGNDPMKEQRKRFVNEYLLPPNGKTVVQNTMDIFLKAFC